MSGKQATKVGHGLAKALGIKLAYRDPLGANADPVTRGESTFSVGTAETYSYLEPEPTTMEWFEDHIPTARQVGSYFYNLFPFLRWITRYNLQWFLGDLVAGVTVGAVVVPQGMAYAKLALLPVQYGLYSSFMGVLIYWLFATSKDITIGPVAVMSTVTGNIILSVQSQHPGIPAPAIAAALAIICGAIVTGLGLLRLGFVVDFIPLPAISAFMTGAAITILVGQVRTMLGEKAHFSTRDATYKVIIDTIKNLPSASIDAAMGVTALAMLYAIRYGCAYAAKKNPHRAKLFFFLSTLRTVFVILFYTMISAAVNIHRKDNPLFKTLGVVPRGFQAAGVPKLDASIISSFSSQLPAAVIVLLIEHVAISKSFGRVNNYTIDPSQELVAIGVTNLLGPFLGAYPATGSFSRTAIKSKSGVRTPLAGVITAAVVLLAIYALPAVFFYIPSAPLSGVIIHAVADLITPPNTVYQFWRVSPLDVIIFFIGVFVTIFTSIETGIYCTVCVSVAVLLFRVAKARGQFLGRVKIHSVVGDHLVDHEGKYGGGVGPGGGAPTTATATATATSVPFPPDEDRAHRTIFLPLNHADGSNPEIELDQPYPGIFIYRFSEGFNYPNANHYTDYMVETIFRHTRRTDPQSFARLGDRPWNNPGPRRGQAEEDRSHLPTLRAVILDFASVNNVDVTSIQNLIDVRNQLDLYAAPEPVQWHFAHINNRWTKRALAAAGFGYPTLASENGFRRWKPIFSVAEIGGSSSAAAMAEMINNQRGIKHAMMHGGHDDLESGSKHEHAPTTTTEVEAGREKTKEDIEIASDSNSTSGSGSGSGSGEGSGSSGEEKLRRALIDSKAYRNNSHNTHLNRVALVQGVNRPFFHIDLTSALQSAIANAGDGDVATISPAAED